MCKLLLVRPSEQYAEQVVSYKEEMSQDGDRFCLFCISSSPTATVSQMFRKIKRLRG